MLFHRHLWKTINYTKVQIWGTNGEHPEGHKTHISQTCTKCGDVRLKIVNGIFKDMDAS